MFFEGEAADVLTMVGQRNFDEGTFSMSCTTETMRQHWETLGNDHM